MPSGSSGRYQSRIFNFVHQQSRRLTEQLEHTIRYVQVATKWGVGVLLYPVYQLLQSTESANKTLYGKEPQTRLQLEAETPSDVDAPIVNVLETVKNLSFAETAATSSNSVSAPESPLALLESLWLKFVPHKPSNKSRLSQSLTISENPAGSLNPSPIYPTVQGIATNLEKRNLLLISADNEILDILTPQEQAKLEDLIINEVANYWRTWRLLKVKKETNLLPEIERLLTKLTGGKLEQTPALNASTVTEEVSGSNYLLNSPGALTFLDAAVANLESNALVPIQQRSREIIQVAHTQFNIFLYGKEQLAARGQIQVNTDDLETQTLNIPALFAAALNYFFGIGSGKKLDTRETATKLPGKRLSLSSSRQLKKEVITADPWLKWGDLFGDAENLEEPPVTLSPNTNPVIDSSASATPSAAKNLIKKYQKFLQIPQLNVGLGKKKKSPPNLSHTQKKSGKATSAKSTTSRISKPSNNGQKGEISQRYPSTQLEAKPDWIETKATLVGYEKHILEQILELLDSIMLWLERIFVNMMMFLRGLLGVK
ncbi:MAG: hypothetical protein RMX68_007145 [Aulosira sp. ZfuVER01]|nr:hypothetical protein [Aulosira sp. ZfuVER01]MDZ7998406.1 hypothetical protein [Aulosira sp. DedVER01a]MDZ8050183.1 hypothetical protein [Aulosira sp. ZfuCHP01]